MIRFVLGLSAVWTVTVACNWAAVTVWFAYESRAEHYRSVAIRMERSADLVPQTFSLLITGAGGERVGSVQHMIQGAAHLCGIRPALLASLVQRESSGDRFAVSSAGAVGLTQLMPATARMMGVKDRTDPWQSLLGGACYLRLMLDAHGTEKKALVAYHAGPGNVRRGTVGQVSKDYAYDVIQGAN